MCVRESEKLANQDSKRDLPNISRMIYWLCYPVIYGAGPGSEESSNVTGKEKNAMAKPGTKPSPSQN